MSLVAAIVLSLAASAACPAEPALAQLVAASDRVIVGIYTAPEALAREAERATPDHVDLPLSGAVMIKGRAPPPKAIRVYPKDAPYKPALAALKAHAGAPAIVFVSEPKDEPEISYFAGYTPEALQAAAPDRVAAVRAEVARQRGLLAAWKLDRKTPHFNEVRGLVAKLGMAPRAEQARVFLKLEALGPDAVPAIVAVMDDRRRLRHPYISLANQAPDAFEAYRHYGAERVVDGLAAVLNQITGENFGGIDAETERERAAAVAGWRVYVADLRCGMP